MVYKLNHFIQFYINTFSEQKMAAIPFLSLSFSPLIYASYVLFLACHVTYFCIGFLLIYHNKIFQLKKIYIMNNKCQL